MHTTENSPLTWYPASTTRLRGLGAQALNASRDTPLAMLPGDANRRAGPGAWRQRAEQQQQRHRLPLASQSSLNQSRAVVGRNLMLTVV